MQAVFYKAGQPCNIAGVEMRTDKPGILMLKKRAEGKYTLYAADPTQQQETLTVTIKKDGKQQVLVLELPRPPYAGQTIQREVAF